MLSIKLLNDFNDFIKPDISLTFMFYITHYLYYLYIIY